MKGLFVEKVEAWPLSGELRRPFAIATGRHDDVANVWVKATLSGGGVGWGECAPAPHITGETQASTLEAVRRLAPLVLDRHAGEGPALGRLLAEAAPRAPCARAGLETAVLDAHLRALGVPLLRWLGGGPLRVRTDVTISLGPLAAAPLDAARLARDGIRVLKVKIGRDPGEDLERVRLISHAAPRLPLLLDANQGYDWRTAKAVWAELKSRGTRLLLFEQPVPKADWDGLARLTRAGIPVCADESVSTPEDARRMARRPVVGTVNLKLMKSGVWGCLELAAVLRTAGLKLMFGGMVESSLAMGCAAQLASALGAVVVDLDTPLFMRRDPVRGLRLRRDGVWDLSKVRAGVGAEPSPAPR